MIGNKIDKLGKTFYFFYINLVKTFFKKIQLLYKWLLCKNIVWSNEWQTTYLNYFLFSKIIIKTLKGLRKQENYFTKCSCYRIRYVTLKILLSLKKRKVIVLLLLKKMHRELHLNDVSHSYIQLLTFQLLVILFGLVSLIQVYNEAFSSFVKSNRYLIKRTRISYKIFSFFFLF